MLKELEFKLAEALGYRDLKWNATCDCWDGIEPAPSVRSYPTSVWSYPTSVPRWTRDSYWAFNLMVKHDIEPIFEMRDTVIAGDPKCLHKAVSINYSDRIEVIGLLSAKVAATRLAIVQAVIEKVSI